MQKYVSFEENPLSQIKATQWFEDTVDGFSTKSNRGCPWRDGTNVCPWQITDTPRVARPARHSLEGCHDPKKQNNTETQAHRHNTTHP